MLMGNLRQMQKLLPLASAHGRFFFCQAFNISSLYDIQHTPPIFCISSYYIFICFF